MTGVRAAWTISAVVHVAVIGYGLASFTWTKPSATDTPELVSAGLVPESDVSKITSGVANAPNTQPKPLADKVGDPKPVKELAPKVVDKPDITTDTHTSAPDPKQQPKQADKAEKPKDAKPKPDQNKPDQIADELKKEEAKKAAKPEKKQPEFKPDQIAEELKRDEAKKQRIAKFDADQVAALLDKREPQRQLAAADTLNNAASLGAPTGRAVQLSMSEQDALSARLRQCWNPPAGLDPESKVYVVLEVQFTQDAMVAQEPAIIESTAASLGPSLAESAKRALLSCQPFTMLRPEHYELWKDIKIKFNNELRGG